MLHQEQSQKTSWKLQELRDTFYGEQVFSLQCIWFPNSEFNIKISIKPPNMHIKIPFLFVLTAHLYTQEKYWTCGTLENSKKSFVQEYRLLHTDVASNTLHCTEPVPLSLAVADV